MSPAAARAFWCGQPVRAARRSPCLAHILYRFLWHHMDEGSGSRLGFQIRDLILAPLTHVLFRGGELHLAGNWLTGLLSGKAHVTRSCCQQQCCGMDEASGKKAMVFGRLVQMAAGSSQLRLPAQSGSDVVSTSLHAAPPSLHPGEHAMAFPSSMGSCRLFVCLCS